MEQAIRKEIESYVWDNGRCDFCDMQAKTCRVSYTYGQKCILLDMSDGRERWSKDATVGCPSLYKFAKYGTGTV